MQTKNWLSSAILTATLVFAGIAIAQERYPALSEAQHHIQQAIAKVDEAQNAHHGHLGGHAEKAKELLQQADRELAAAKDYAEHHR